MTEAEQKAREELVRDLKRWWCHSHTGPTHLIYGDCKQAADTIEALTRALAIREEVVEVLRFYAGEWYQDQWENSGERRPSEWIDSVSVNPTRELYADRGERARALLASIERGDG